MTHFVTEYSGQLRFVAQIRQDAARDVDESARQRERVHRGLVNHRELPRQVRPMRRLRELHADVGHIRLPRRVLVHAHRLAHVGVGLAAHLDFLRLGDEHELALSCGGICGAIGGDDREKKDGYLSH